MIGGDPRVHKNQLKRLRDTDLWHRTYRIRDDARCGYLFAVNDPPVPLDDIPEQKEVVKRLLTFKPDPLNPKRDASQFLFAPSVLELPDAPPQPWAKKRDDIAAAFAGYRHPEVFGNVLSQSGF
jgi:enterochelin esterase-like enzyme